MAFKSFSDLRKSRGDITKLTQEAEKLNQKSFGDDRIWSPTQDKAGNGSAIIRFLPAPQGEDIPWVRVWSHGFQGPGGKWYIENCPTTLGQNCPVCEHNSELWNSGSESKKEVARNQKRKLSYYSNIYVIKDPGNTENEGKVFLYRYGSKIFDKIKGMMHPEFEDDVAINPFDMWEGTNFRLRIAKVSGNNNYDKSEFEKNASALSDDDEELQKIWEQEHALNEFVDPKNFKGFDELKKKLDMVLGTSRLARAEETNLDETPAPAPKAAKAKAPKEARIESEEDEEEEEDTLAYFKRLAEGDDD